MWIDDTGLSSNHQSLHAVVVMVKHNSLLFAILSSKVLDTRRVVLLSIPTYLLRSYSFGRTRLIPLVKEHYKATQMLPEAILHHYRPPTSSTHNTLIHQNAGKTYLPIFNSDTVGSPSTTFNVNNYNPNDDSFSMYKPFTTVCTHLKHIYPHVPYIQPLFTAPSSQQKSRFSSS